MIVFGGTYPKITIKTANTINSVRRMNEAVNVALIDGIDLGKQICVINEDLFVRLLNAIEVPFLKKFHVMIPVKRQIGKFSISNLNMVENTKNKTPNIKRGSMKLHRTPNTEFLYFIFRSEIAKLNKIPRMDHISSIMDFIGV